MIAFGCSIISPELYTRCAGPGIERVREPDSQVMAIQAAGSIFRSYNLILDEIARRAAGLEALVLVHEDTEICDPHLCRKLRRALQDPQVAVVGAAGASGAHNIAWWEGSVRRGSFRYRYPELGGGELSVVRGEERGEVQTVDGFLLALSPWAVENVRFDESLGPHWGYDFDYCQQVRAAGRKVVVADLDAVHHHSLTLADDVEPWIAAHMRASEKWDPAPDAVPEGAVAWRARARRAEAEAVVARLQRAAIALQADAQTGLHGRRLSHITESPSWRLTAPLRRANAWLRERRRRPAA